VETKNMESPEIKSLSSLYFQRAEIYYELKQYSNSIEDLKKVVSLNVNGSVKSDTFYHLAVCYRNTDEYEKAVENINKAMVMAGEPVPEYFIERGLSYYKLEKYNPALRDFLEGLKSFAYHPEAIRTLALSYDKLGNIQGTMENMLLAAEQGDSFAKEYIKDLGYFVENEYNQLFQ
jgi:tetratricopeptide (TPR) repeat protein